MYIFLKYLPINFAIFITIKKFNHTVFFFITNKQKYSILSNNSKQKPVCRITRTPLFLKNRFKKPGKLEKPSFPNNSKTGLKTLGTKNNYEMNNKFDR